MKLCVCGTNCEICQYFGKECMGGCEGVEGKVYWVCYVDKEVCPIYECAKSKGFENCGKCGELPCRIWYDLKDPSYSDEEHIKSINERVAALKHTT